MPSKFWTRGTAACTVNNDVTVFVLCILLLKDVDAKKYQCMWRHMYFNEKRIQKFKGFNLLSHRNKYNETGI